MATPESVKSKIRDLFSDNFFTYLEDVEDSYVDSDPLRMKDIQEYHILDSTAYRYVTAKQFPALFILDGTMIESTGQARTHFWDLEVVLVLELQHQDPATLSKLKSRYREAMWDLLQDYRSLDGVAAGMCTNFRWERSGTVALRGGSAFQQSTPLAFTAKVSQL